MKREPRTDRHAALMLAGEAEMRRLEESWPTRVGELPAHRQALQGRTHSSPYQHSDFDPIRAYRGGNGPAWRLLNLLFVVALFGGAGVAAFLYLAR